MKMTQAFEREIAPVSLQERLAHQARVETHERIPISLDLGLRHESRDRVDDDHVDGVGAHERLTNVERLLPVVGLGNQQS